ncbi:MAG: hypothetical protein EA377_00420 [Phycisphaerales bacterium]|nr:MAG: hypothetical protein EA377_00420 [Phycisphaerales bacterium]
MTALDWLILGGGVHGMHLAHTLRLRGRVPADRLRVLDPHDEPLALWKRQTANVGMRFLRSASVHQLHADAMSLQHFARSREGKPFAQYRPPYHRPGLDLFNAHCDRVLEQEGLQHLRVRGRAERIRLSPTQVEVDSDAGTLRAKNVLLAFGATEQPHVPDWCSALPASAYDHVLDPDFHPGRIRDDDRVIIVGGGISAAQFALSMVEAADTSSRPSPREVTLITRHELRTHQFDSHQCWIGPKCLRAFDRETDYGQRRRMIAEARNRGSMPDDVARPLRRAIQSGRMQHIVSGIDAARSTGDSVVVTLKNEAAQSTRRIEADRIVLATGFSPARPGGTMLDELIQAHGLPTGPCGYPIVDRCLRWHPRLFVTGALAELEIGPVARNIIGARLAGDRLLMAI